MPSATNPCIVCSSLDAKVRHLELWRPVAKFLRLGKNLAYSDGHDVQEDVCDTCWQEIAQWAETTAKHNLKKRVLDETPETMGGFIPFPTWNVRVFAIDIDVLGHLRGEVAAYDYEAMRHFWHVLSVSKSAAVAGGEAGTRAEAQAACMKALCEIAHAEAEALPQEPP